LHSPYSRGTGINRKIEDVLAETPSGDLESNWLSSVGTSTAKVYKYGLEAFEIYLDAKAPEITRKLKPASEEQVAKLLKRFYIDLIDVGLTMMDRRNKRNPQPEHRRFAPKTAFIYLTGVRQFLASAGIKCGEVKITGHQHRPIAVRQKYNFSREDLQKILKVAPLRERCLFLLGASSGWDVSDILSLKVENVLPILDSPRRMFVTKRIKTGYRMLLCLTRETAQNLKTYIQFEKLGSDDYLFPGRKKGTHLHKGEPDWSLKEYAKQAGIVSASGDPIRFHGLRAYFNRTAENNSLPQAVTKLCMGHQLDDMEVAYSSRPDEELWEQWQKIESSLTVETNVAVNGLEKTVKGLEAKLSSLEQENEELKRNQGKDVEFLRAKVDLLAKVIESMKQGMFEEKLAQAGIKTKKT
jgi:integrase